MSILKKGDRIRVVTSRNPDIVGQCGTLLEGPTQGKHTRNGIPVETVYIRFDLPQLADQGFATRDMEMPADQLEKL